MEYGDELKTFINIWFIAISSICYCYFIPSRIAHGVPRLLALLPIITIFSILPFPISTVHLAFPTCFFLVWLGNFKLLLFAFNYGLLSSKPQLPILTFICIALSPINPKQVNNNNNNNNILLISNPFPLPLPIKTMIIMVIIYVYQYKDNFHSTMIIAIHFSHIFFGFEIGFAVTAFLAKIFLGFSFEIEPLFNEPHLATSVQDFWGRRWNLVSSSILRTTVYNPVRMIWTPTLGVFWSQQVAIIVTFVVSGLMHELMFFYLMCVPPTREVTWFFVLQGVCTAAEVAVKKAVNNRFQLHRVVSGPLTLAFMFMTGCWLFYA
ncbi:long-chain-alcohol O-fatty-acyltransferase-like [Bidens hawaiensis]|uniref:long-chain-alcohol O-fatty-acyltransferase-like n=1 Tax=Bidens hawaiensis TaxID=980011 RepID=UPI004049B0A9